MTEAAEARGLFTSFEAAPRKSGGGVEKAMLLGLGQTAGRSTVEELRALPGAQLEFGAAESNRYLYVLAGEWRIAVEDERHDCAPDTTVVVPARAACEATVMGDGDGKLLVLTCCA